MDWARDLPGWPNAALSHRVRHATHLWHVQEDGSGETVLLLHGAGGSSHSWRDLLPRLARHRHVIALDLPGQGFTRTSNPARLGLDPMTEDIAALCADQGWTPGAVIGHSAGGAIALNLARHLSRPDGTPPRVIGINAALDRFEGIAGWLFPVLAKMLALNPFTATLFTLGSRETDRARRLIEGTGSQIDAAGLACYARLIADRAHVEATLQMMARWNIDRLIARLPEIPARCLLITGAADTAVLPAVSARAAERLPDARTVDMDGLGHLAHEEAPDRVLAEISGFLDDAG